LFVEGFRGVGKDASLLTFAIFLDHSLQVINTPRPETRSKRRLKLPMSSDNSTEIDSGSDRQKIRSRRSTARYESPVQRSGQPSGAPGVNVGSTSMTMTHSALESPPKSEAMHRVQPPNGPTESHAAG